MRRRYAVDLAKLLEIPHRRFNPLTREWVLVSPHRNQRPWQGQTEHSEREAAPQFDPQCYLCPGNVRAGGVHNPRYLDTYVFDNDFAALQPDLPSIEINEGGTNLLSAASESGTCCVVCFSPRHDLTLAAMEVASISKVVDVWVEQYAQLGALPGINYVQIFENRGAMMGCSNSHPHGQIWANQTVPNIPRTEEESFLVYSQQHHSCLLCDYLGLERSAADRIVLENDSFLVVVPFWATWPFETLVLSKRHAVDIAALDAHERNSLADILQRLTARYDGLFQTSFPYSMGFHQRPTDGQEHNEWHFHAHFFPPLLRSANTRKFMVGYELLASPQRDITPEEAAHKLRSRS